jgi:hypothetical protein
LSSQYSATFSATSGLDVNLVRNWGITGKERIVPSMVDCWGYGADNGSYTGWKGGAGDGVLGMPTSIAAAYPTVSHHAKHSRVPQNEVTNSVLRY